MTDCPKPAPGPDWVCKNGGWLPPGHPLLSEPVPAEADYISPNLPAPMVTGPDTGYGEYGGTYDLSVEELQGYASAGLPLPGGTVIFTPPLRLRDMTLFQGGPGGTVLRPRTPAAGPLVIIETSIGGNYELYYPNLQLIQDIVLTGHGIDRGQTGIYLNGAHVRFARVTVAGCAEGVYVNIGVNVAFRDCLFTRNRVGLMFQGLPENSITTFRLSGCRVAQSTRYGIRVQHAMGLILDDSTIIEGNAGVGLSVAADAAARNTFVMCRDVWFEQNGQHIHDPAGVVRKEGFTGVR